MSPSMATARTHPSPSHTRRGLAMIIATVLALSSLSFLASPASAAPNDPPTVVSLTFDDGNADQMPAAAIMKAHSMPGTFYVNSGAIGMAGYLTRAQLDTLAADGNEIAGHTLNHTDLATLPTEEARRQICVDRANLINWGFAPRSFAYPFASLTPEVTQLAQYCGYNSARSLGDIESRFGCAGCANAESIPPSSPYETKALDEVDSTWTLQDFQDAVTKAEQSGGGWVQFTFHNFCGAVCGELSVSESVFTQFLDWLALRKASNNTSVKTVGDVVGGTVKPAVATPPPTPITDPSGLNNPGFESVNSLGAPICWQQAGFGTNTAAFSTVTPGRTGTKAARLTVSGYVDGDAKLLPSLDLGTCSPPATAGKSYTLRSWYTSTASTQYAVYLRTTAGGWVYWTSSPYFAASTAYTQALWTTPAIPAGYDGISFGLNLFSNGTLTADDYSISATDATPVSSAVVSPAVPDGTDGWYKTKPTVSLTLETGSEGAVRQYSFDGGATWTDYTAPIVVPDGTRTMSYRAKTSDTVVEAARTISFKVDSTPPIVTPSFDKATRKVTATAADATSGAGPIQFREGSGPWGTFSGPITRGPDAATLEFRVTDAAGNLSPVATLKVPAQVASTTRLSLSPASTTYGKHIGATINVDVPAGEPAATGSVTVLADGTAVGTGSVVNGTATVTLTGTLSVGTHSLTASYAGNGATKSSTSAPVSLTIAKATPKVSLKLSSSKARAGRTKIQVKTTVSVPGTSVRPSGRLNVLVDGKIVRRATLSTSRNGKLTITLPKFKSRMSGKKVRISVVFAGSSTLKAVTSTKRTLRIR